MSFIEPQEIYKKPLYRFPFRMAGRGLGKKLFAEFEEDNDTPSVDAIKVFLRLKPSTGGNGNIVKVLDSKTVLFKMPSDMTQSWKKLNIPEECKYTFSNIFGSEVTQSDIFTGCVAPLVKSLFDGQHCLLFTYGTTNAGKTFTVLGTGDKPGIIPRTLTTVFKSIRGKEYTNPRIRPIMFNSALEVNEDTLREECASKQKLLNWNPDKTQIEMSKMCKTQSTNQSSVEDMIIGDSVFKEMQKRLTNDTSIVEYLAEPEDRFSVWISFAEIYNEAVYDLLEPIAKSGKRKPLKLAQDGNRNMYIKGLKHVFVQSEEEAYKVLRFGKNNLQVGATGMNSSSSRSHCIFTIKLMKCLNVQQPDRVTISSFAICDLAGAERQKKTLNIGLRLRESQNINCSLHVLSRCFTIIRENQLNNENKLIPFRDSKLTLLFQRALLGKECVTMIVNVNVERELCEETQHVLKASAIAKHIVVQPRVTKRPPRVSRRSMFSQIIHRHNRSTLIRWDSCVKAKGSNIEAVNATADTEFEPTELENNNEEYENLLATIQTLQEKLKEEKAKNLQLRKTWREKEDEIRKEMEMEVKKMLAQAKEQNVQDMKRAHDIEDENKLGRLIHGVEDVGLPTKQVKLQVNSNEEEYNWEEINDLKEEIKIQQKRIDGLTNLVNIFRDEKKELTMALTSAKLNLGWKDKEIENLKNKIEMFGEENEMQAAYLALEKEMKSQVKVRDNLLDEARSDLLEELRVREEHEEEITKLEKELTEKEGEKLLLQTEIQDMNDEIDAKTNALEMLERHMDIMESDFTEEIQKAERQCCKLEAQLFSKDEEIARLNQMIKNIKEESKDDEQCQEIVLLKNKIEELLCEKSVLDEQLAKQCADFEAYKEEAINKFNRKDSDLEFIKKSLKDLENEIALKHTKIEDLERFVDSMNLAKEKVDIEHSSELSMLEQNLKQQIQEHLKLQEKQIEKTKENEQLCKELDKVQDIVAELKSTLKDKEHDLECTRNRIMGYENSFPTLEAEFNRQRKELLEYKWKYEEQISAICNMEQEQNSFQANQKEIIGKYEDQLKKTKEENESLKKEIASITNTFYKSTPTPKKVLENQNEELKKQNYDLIKQNEEFKRQLEELQTNYHKLQQQEKENTHIKIRFESPEETNKENVNEFGYPITNSLRHLKLDDQDTMIHRTRIQSSSATKSVTGCQADVKKSRSATKSTRRTRANAALFVGNINNASESKTSENPKKPARKMLFDASTHDVLQFENVEVDMNIPQDSPGTIIKRSLRRRNK